MDLEQIIGTDIMHIKDFQHNGSGDLKTLSGIESLKQKLFRRIITIPGSIANRPTFGAGLTTFLNKTMDISTKRMIANAITEQVKEEPQITDVLGVTFSEEKDSVRIGVIVTIEGVGDQTFNYSVNKQ